MQLLRVNTAGLQAKKYHSRDTKIDFNLIIQVVNLPKGLNLLYQELKVQRLKK